MPPTTPVLQAFISSVNSFQFATTLKHAANQAPQFQHARPKIEYLPKPLAVDAQSRSGGYGAYHTLADVATSPKHHKD